MNWNDKNEYVKRLRETQRHINHMMLTASSVPFAKNLTSKMLYDSTAILRLTTLSILLTAYVHTLLPAIVARYRKKVYDEDLHDPWLTTRRKRNNGSLILMKNEYLVSPKRQMY